MYGQASSVSGDIGLTPVKDLVWDLKEGWLLLTDLVHLV